MQLDKLVLQYTLKYLVDAGLNQLMKGTSYNAQFAVKQAAGLGVKWIADNYSQSIFDFVEDMAMAAGTRDPKKIAENARRRADRRARELANKILADNKR